MPNRPLAMNIELRDACAADRPVLLRVYAGTRADELALTGWDDATCEAFVALQFDAQERAYRAQFPHSRCQVIGLTDGVDTRPTEAIGRLWVDRGMDAIRIVDISLLPAQRDRGIGAHCLRMLQSEAALAGLPVELHVLATNPARRLYARLGFVVTGQHGLHLAMQWRATKDDSLRITDAGRRTLEICDEQA